jgi:hypothetical protein
LKSKADELDRFYRECVQIRVTEFLVKLAGDPEWEAKRQAIENEARENSIKRLLDRERFHVHELTREEDLPVAGGASIPKDAKVIVPEGFERYLDDAPQILLTKGMDEGSLPQEKFKKGAEKGVEIPSGPAPRPATRTR